MQETQETWVRSLGQEDPLEEGMATHFSVLAWRIPWKEEPGELQSTGLKRVGHYQATNTNPAPKLPPQELVDWTFRTHGLDGI